MIHTGELLSFWRGYFDLSWPAQEMCVALAEKFLDRVEICDPKGVVALMGQPALFLANHQTYLESLMFNLAVSPLTRRPTITLAKLGHRERWLGRFVDLVTSFPGLPPYAPIEYFDRENAETAIDETVARIDALMNGGSSLLIHVEGTRRRSSRRGRVIMLSPLWVGLAMTHEWPIVPVRFVGGLPVEDEGVKHDLPVGFGQQIIRVGRPITTAELLALPASERVPYVRTALNSLQDCATEVPGTPDRAFGAEVHDWAARTGIGPVPASILEALRRSSQNLSPECRALLEAADRMRAGLPANLLLPPTVEGHWLGQVADFLLGTARNVSHSAKFSPNDLKYRTEAS